MRAPQKERACTRLERRNRRRHQSGHVPTQTVEHIVIYYQYCFFPSSSRAQHRVSACLRVLPYHTIQHLEEQCRVLCLTATTFGTVSEHEG
jgi:hypothetical protein